MDWMDIKEGDGMGYIQGTKRGLGRGKGMERILLYHHITMYKCIITMYIITCTSYHKNESIIYKAVLCHLLLLSRLMQHLNQSKVMRHPPV